MCEEKHRKKYEDFNINVLLKCHAFLGLGFIV